MVDPGVDRHAVIVASERLSEDPGWQRVEPNHLVAASDARKAEIRALDV